LVSFIQKFLKLHFVQFNAQARDLVAARC